MSAQVTRPLDELKPNPDPSTATTAQLLREFSNFREIQEAKFETFVIRFAAMDRAIELVAKYPTEVDKSVANLRALHDEKFNGIHIQFAERDTRTERTARDNKVAIDAALQAQKEAVGKSEVGFTKQIDAIGVLINQFAKSSDEKIDDLKTRITASESQKKGADNTWGYIVAGAGILIALISLYLANAGP